MGAMNTGHLPRQRVHELRAGRRPRRMKRITALNSYGYQVEVWVPTLWSRIVYAAQAWRRPR